MNFLRRSIGWVAWGIAALVVLVIGEAVKEMDRRDRRP